MDYQQSSAWDPCATLATFLTLDDLSKASNTFSPNEHPQFRQSGAPAPETPVLKLVDDAKDKGYKRLCIPLTTAKWEARWTRMCLLPTESSDEDKEQAKEAEQWRLNPGFQREEVTITRLGGCIQNLRSPWYWK
jgi:protein arginine N-methyltransferase 5